MSLSDRDYDEKRNFIRMQISAPTDVLITREDGSTIHGTCQNLSGGGIHLMIDQAITVGETATVKIASEHGHKPMLEAKAKAVRCAAEGDQFNVGMEITEMI